MGLPNPFTALSGPGSGIVDPIYDTLLQGPFQFGAPLIPWLATRFDTSAEADPNQGANWLANALSPFVGDANAYTPETKAFLVDIKKI